MTRKRIKFCLSIFVLLFLPLGCEKGESDKSKEFKLRRKKKKKQHDKVKQKAQNKKEEIRRKKERKNRLERSVLAGTEGSCENFVFKSPVSNEICVSLQKVMKDGRTTASIRRSLRNMVKERGTFRLRGFMIARSKAKFGEEVYEIKKSGSRTHALLKVTLTTFRSRGRFRLWARKIDTVDIKTVNGFTQRWKYYEEDALGTAIQQIFDARAGENTSRAARAILGAFIDNAELK